MAGPLDMLGPDEIDGVVPHGAEAASPSAATARRGGTATTEPDRSDRVSVARICDRPASERLHLRRRQCGYRCQASPRFVSAPPQYCQPLDLLAMHIGESLSLEWY